MMKLRLRELHYLPKVSWRESCRMATLPQLRLGAHVLKPFVHCPLTEEESLEQTHEERTLSAFKEVFQDKEAVPV